jgi:hypothetical protein
MEYIRKHIKRHIPTRCKDDLRKGINKKAQSTQRIWVKHLHGIDPRSSRDPPNTGGAEAAQLGCGRTPTGPDWPKLWSIASYHHAQHWCWGYVYVQHTWRSVWCFPSEDQAYSMGHSLLTYKRRLPLFISPFINT